MRNRKWFCLYILLSIVGIIMLIYGLLYVWEYSIDCTPHHLCIESHSLDFTISSCEHVNPLHKTSYHSCELLVDNQTDGPCRTSEHQCVVSHQFITTINMTLISYSVSPPLHLDYTYQHSQPNAFIADQDLLQSWNQTLTCYYTHSIIHF